MSVFTAIDYDDHEEVHFFNDKASGLRAIIAIHNTARGPALGGCRMWSYESEDAAIADVLRLSRGMTYKAAVLGVELGGGKSVIIGDPHTQKTPELLKAMGRAIASLNERYIVGEDIGTNPDDMREIGLVTNCVSCRRKEDGGYGDPAPLTALGVLSAMRAGVEVVYQRESFEGLKVTVQGVGNVGRNLCRQLVEEGATLVVADVHAANVDWAVENLGARAVAPEDIYSADADVFAPCSVGAIVNDETIGALRARLICGAANNQLARPYHADRLADAGIVYVPDYVANAGGLASCDAEWYGLDSEQVEGKVRGIYHTCKELLQESRQSNRTTTVVADEIAESRLVGGGD